MAFAVTADSPGCRAFYEGKLGFAFVEEDEYAVVFNANGTILRLQKAKAHTPAMYTVLGWKTSDIRATVAKLGSAGVKVERFEWMSIQDASGVATFANGDKVAWFKDPDGNVLSVAQLAR